VLEIGHYNLLFFSFFFFCNYVVLVTGFVIAHQKLVDNEYFFEYFF